MILLTESKRLVGHGSSPTFVLRREQVGHCGVTRSSQAEGDAVVHHGIRKRVQAFRTRDEVTIFELLAAG